ncbi:GNAT family N-acetyltransferase [Hymenobacter oligotrophus]|uniref:GNAT family N-acetyltransferase n=1 Tax=Hymenobacter oligotrophus TaxID=2319843 RepID=A0A3B7QZF5_9BACT|nr:GNAT family N-acetyltransferase [Hymenobacter oligotrophus]AYA36593.1 GNAT family N-acetyltransferase [Hymenobacter oligotrophus]
MTEKPFASNDVSAAAVSGEACALRSGSGRYQMRWQTELAPALPLADELYLYVQPAQLAHATGQRLLLLLEDHHLGQTVGWWPVLVGPDAVAHSPWQAPLGGPQLLRPDVPAAVLDEWLTLGHLGLAARGARQLVQRLAPFAYEPRTTGALVAALQRTGHRVSLAEIDSYLPLEQPYEARLYPSERRRLHKCLRHGFRVEQEPPLLLPLAYEFLRRCREEKGQALSLTQEQLQDLFRRFPREYLLFSVRDAAGEWVALTVAVLAGRGVLYNFYPASPLQYNAFSPVVLLNAGLHAFAQASGLRLLDLGTSTLPTGLNESLLRFKRHLGGVPSLKLTLERAL